jgi:hypothetical protein
MPPCGGGADGHLKENFACRPLRELGGWTFTSDGLEQGPGHPGGPFGRVWELAKVGGDRLWGHKTKAIGWLRFDFGRRNRPECRCTHICPYQYGLIVLFDAV